MAQVFRIWFSMGFFVILNYMALILQAGCQSSAYSRRLRGPIMFFQLTVGVFFFIWLTLGLLWRFSAAGKVASAERLLGKFEEEQTKMVNRDKPTGKLPETAGY